MPVRIASGKFHGAITATTPRGSYESMFVSPGGQICTGLGANSDSASRA
jgi:hypothetical protein